MLEIYTDGACVPNPGVGGWGFVVIRNGVILYEANGHGNHTTNNRMEIMAAGVACRHAKIIFPGEPCIIMSDSQYVINGMTKWMAGWIKKDFLRKGEPMPNHDLWKKMHTLTKDMDVKWSWVRGHSGNVFNERADELAGMGRRKVFV